MDAQPLVWPRPKPADDVVLRRILAGMWGLALCAMLFVPSMSLTEGFGFAEFESPPARYERLLLGMAGMVTVLGALLGARGWGRALLLVLPLLVGLAVWESLAHAGAWWTIWWRPLLGCLWVAVPAWLLLGQGVPAT